MTSGQALEPNLTRRRERGLRFAGYAAVFDRPDKGGDVVRSGAFRATLARSGEVPLLWQHDPRRVIGRIEHLSEDGRGLRVIASIDSEAEAAAVRAGTVKGLSFGYRVRGARGPDRDHGLRELVELDLIEVSLVALPMQARAMVHAVEG